MLRNERRVGNRPGGPATVTDARPVPGYDPRMQLRASRFRPRRAAAFAAVALLAFAPASASAKDADQPSPRQALERVEQAQRGELTGRDVTLANRDLAIALPDLGPRDRARAKRLMARPTDPDGDSYINYGGVTPNRICSAPGPGVRFCIHYVPTGLDAPNPTDLRNAAGTPGSGANGVPDYIDTMLREFEFVANRENTQLGWPDPISDGTAGGGDEFDVYVGDIGNQGVYGYAMYETPSGDPNSIHVPAYMAMDNDYSATEFPGYTDYLIPLQVTAAHEYNHVLQGGIDVEFDDWFGEATATWMEEQVYPSGNDWIGYLDGWARIPEVPVTSFTPDAPWPADNKQYGSSVLLHWLSDRPGVGPDAIRDGWLQTAHVSPNAYAVAALDAGLAAHGGSSTTQAFGAFAAATAEWRVPASGFHDRNLYAGIVRRPPTSPGLEVARSGALSDASPRSDTIDHTGYRLYTVLPNGSDAVRLNVTAPAGVASSIALVGRTGGIDTGTVTTRRLELPLGGKGSVTLDGLAGFNRVTAVVANTGTEVTGWDPTIGPRGNWTFAGDGRSYAVTATKDLSDPVDPSPDPVPADPTPADPPVTVPVAPTPPAPGPRPTAPAPKLVVPSKAKTLSALRDLGNGLARQLRTHGITKLRSTRPAFSFSAPSAGRLDVRVTVGGKTVSSVRANASRAGRLKARLKATPSGRRLLRSGSRKTATVVLRFTPKGGATQELRGRITIRR